MVLEPRGNVMVLKSFNTNLEGDITYPCVGSLRNINGLNYGPSILQQQQNLKIMNKHHVDKK